MKTELSYHVAGRKSGTSAAEILKGLLREPETFFNPKFLNLEHPAAITVVEEGEGTASFCNPGEAIKELTPPPPNLIPAIATKKNSSAENTWDFNRETTLGELSSHRNEILRSILTYHNNVFLVKVITSEP